MGHDDIPGFLGLLAVILITTQVLGALARKVGQPEVLGELVAGVLLGTSVLGLVDPDDARIRLLAEIGLVLLLLGTGLETDLHQLMRVGVSALLVALVGVLVPFLLGYGLGLLLGLPSLTAIVAGATMTATSVGITARVLSDLGRLNDPESRIILGAAVADDIIGLIILSVVTGLVAGQAVSLLSLFRIITVAVGFLAITLSLGQWLVPLLFRTALRLKTGSYEPLLGTLLALALAWLASRVGSAVIIGAFAAGLLLTRTPYHAAVRHGVVHIGDLFVPLFFVSVGAAFDVQIFNYFRPDQRRALLLGLLFLVAAVAGKLVAGYVPVRRGVRRAVVGVGMIPRGEVGLIFAQLGLSTGIFKAAHFSSMVLMVIGTTFLAPPLLRYLLGPAPQPKETPPKHLAASGPEEKPHPGPEASQ